MHVLTLFLLFPSDSPAQVLRGSAGLRDALALPDTVPRSHSPAPLASLPPCLPAACLPPLVAVGTSVLRQGLFVTSRTADPPLPPRRRFVLVSPRSSMLMTTAPRRPAPPRPGGYRQMRVNCNGASPALPAGRCLYARMPIKEFAPRTSQDRHTRMEEVGGVGGGESERRRLKRKKGTRLVTRHD